MIAAIVVASTTSSGVLMPRFGHGPDPGRGPSRPVAWSSWRRKLGLRTSYPGQILAALLRSGRLGLAFGCALNTATYGAGAADAGVASAWSTPTSRSAARSAPRC